MLFIFFLNYVILINRGVVYVWTSITIFSVYSYFFVGNNFFGRKRISNTETKLYSIIIIVNIIGVLLDIASTYLALFDFNNPYLNIISKLYLIYLMTVSLLFVYYTISISYNEKKF